MIRATNKFLILLLCLALTDSAWATGPPYILPGQTCLALAPEGNTTSGVQTVLRTPRHRSVKALPSGDDISAKAEAAQQRLEKFMRESVEPRLAYEYKEHFFDEKDAADLASLARAASSDLQGIYRAQERMRKRIEDYEGDDWDRLYGATGEWRKVCTDGQGTRLMKAQVDYYIALTAKSQQRRQILRDVISVCKLSEPVFGRAAVELLKARAMALMARSDRALEEKARAELRSILSAQNLPDEARFAAALEKLKLEQNPDIRQIDALAKRVRRSKCADNFELNLKLAFFALRFGKAGFLKDVITKWPEAGDFAGRVILPEIVERLDGRTVGRLGGGETADISIFEAELAAGAARQKGIEKYREPLVKLCRTERFQTPLLLYVTAQACAGSEPAAALEYYRRSAMAQQKQKNDKFELDAVQIAEQGALLGHKLYYEEPAHRHIVRRMINYYCEIAGDRVDETIQYLYTRLLSGGGRTGEAIELLRKIAEKTGRFSSQAKLDLIVHSLKNGSEDSELRYELTKKLKNLIDSVDSTSKQDRGVKAEATRLYCQLILENDDDASAQEVLVLLEETQGEDIQRSVILRAAALEKLGRLPEAVRQLLAAAEPNGCESAEQGMEVLSAVLAGPIDQLAEKMTDFDVYIQNCDRLGQHCLKCAQPEQWPLAGLICAEFTVLTAGDDKEKIAEAEKILTKLEHKGFDNDIDWLRCKARLLQAKGEFAAAAAAWGRIRAANKTALQVQSRQWWRAKFYEIQCWSKLADTSETDVAHAIEVLEYTCGDIPEFWAVKLEALKDGTGR